MPKTFIFIILFLCNVVILHAQWSGQLTIYNSSRALFRGEVMGESQNDKEISLPYPHGLVQSSLFLSLHDKNNRILEQTLLTPDVKHQLYLKKSFGKKISLVTPERIISGTLINYVDGVIVLENDSGLELYKWRSDLHLKLPEKVDYGETKPSIRLITEKKIKKNDVSMSFIVNSVNWTMNYFLTYDNNKERLSIKANAQIINNTKNNFKSMDVTLVAGDINTVQEDYRYRSKGNFISAVPQEDQEFESASDYYQYHVNYPLSIGPFQKVQVPIFEKLEMNCRKIYKFFPKRDNKHIYSYLKFKTDPSDQSAILPSGVARIYEKVDGRMLLVGEANMRHTSAGEEVLLSSGKAFDLKAKYLKSAVKKLTKRSDEIELKVVLYNYKKQKPETVEVEDQLPGNYEWELVSSNNPSVKLENNTIKFKVSVPANDKTEITYKLIQRW